MIFFRFDHRGHERDPKVSPLGPRGVGDAFCVPGWNSGPQVLEFQVARLVVMFVLFLLGGSLGLKPKGTQSPQRPGNLPGTCEVVDHSVSRTEGALEPERMSCFLKWTSHVLWGGRAFAVRVTWPSSGFGVSGICHRGPCS